MSKINIKYMKSKKILYPILLFMFMLAGCSNSDVKDIVSQSIYIPFQTSSAYYRTPMNQPVEIELQTNKNSNSVAFMIDSYPVKGKLTQNKPEKNKFTYTPDDPTYNGPDSFKFHVTDGTSSSNISTISLFIGDDLTAYNSTVATKEDTPVRFQLRVNNKNLATLDIIIQQQPLHGTLTKISNLEWEYDPADDFNGTDSDSFIFIARAPGFNDSLPATVTITIDPDNDPPVAHALPNQSTYEHMPVAIPLNVTDVDNDPLQYIVSLNPLYGTYSISGSIVTYTPKDHYNGTFTFTYYANDGKSDSNVITVTVTVNPVHDDPVALPQRLVVKNHEEPLEPGWIEFDFPVINPDGGNLIFLIDPIPPDYGKLIYTGTKWKFTAGKNYFGKFLFNYKVTDSEGAESSSVITVNVVPANVIYVWANAPGWDGLFDGKSWDTAYKELSQAIDASTAGSEIWVAQGTYTLFKELKTDVSLYGGFQGNEINKQNRTFTTILDGNNANPILRGELVANVTIDGFTIQNGRATGFGDSYLGGGIFIINSSDIFIKNCIFTSNEAGMGGAVYLGNTANVQLIDNNFTGNIAAANGGAVYFGKVTNSIMTYTTNKGNMSSNKSSGSGGAIYIDQYCGTQITPITIENYNIMSNESKNNDGGGISNNGNSIIKNCTISQNTAKNYGGGISDTTGKTSIENCQIQNNEAGSAGGGIYTQSLTNTSLTLSKCIISDNTIKVSTTGEPIGGGIYNARHNGLKINISTIHNNKTNIKYGGGIYSTGSLHIYGSTINDNTALENGGAIYSSGILRIDTYFDENNIPTYSELKSNKAFRYGGAIYNNIDSSCEIYNSTLSFNKAENSVQDKDTKGGAICGYRHIFLLINNSTFDSNYAKSISGSKGGAICDLQVRDNTTIVNTIFSNNKTMFDLETLPTPIWGSLDLSGGAIYQYNSVSKAVYAFTVCFFTNNSALNKGGAIYHYNSIIGAQFKIENSEFDSNSANNENDISDPTLPAIRCSGGAAHIENKETSNYLITGSIFKENKTSGHGAAIYSDSASESVINETLFQGNFGITKSIPIENTDPQAFDPKLYTYGTFYNKNKAKFTNTVFGENNNVFSGGAIYNAPTGNLYAINCLIMKNIIGITNGAGLFNEGTASLTNCTIADNISASGSGIYNTSNTSTGTINILNSIIWNNNISNSGIINATYSCSNSFLIVDGNINSNPSFALQNPSVKFFGYSIGYYFLKQTPILTKSKCIDAGDPNPLHIPAEISGKTTDSSDINPLIDIPTSPFSLYVDMGYHYKLWL